MIPEQKLLEATYTAFNSRNIKSALQHMHADVKWPNGLEGGYVRGHAEVRSYWTRQWIMLDPKVEPVEFKLDDNGRVVVEGHQIVRDLCGNIVSDRMVTHAFTIEEGLIRTMEITKHAPEMQAGHVYSNDDSQ
jgi:hypothetical protein